MKGGGSQNSSPANYAHWPRHLIDNRDIERSGFRWVTRDRIKSAADSRGSTIVNLADSDSAGTHWCLMIRAANGEFYWFDPIGAGGFPPLELRDVGHPISYNKKAYMPIKSNLCGYYCLVLARAFRDRPPRNGNEADEIARETFAGESPKDVAEDGRGGGGG